MITLTTLITEYHTVWCSVFLLYLKGHSQLCDRADLDTTFVSFEKSLPQPEIK